MRNLKKIVATILTITLSMSCIGNMSTFGSTEFDGSHTIFDLKVECLEDEIKKLIEEKILCDPFNLYCNSDELLRHEKEKLSELTEFICLYKGLLDKFDLTCYKQIFLKKEFRLYGRPIYLHDLLVRFFCLLKIYLNQEFEEYKNVVLLLLNNDGVKLILFDLVNFIPGYSPDEGYFWMNRSKLKLKDHDIL